MNNDLKRLPYNENQRVRIPKKNLYIIYFSVSLALLIIAGFAYYFLVYKNDANMLKRYLIDKGYKCNERTCNKKVGGYSYSIDYKTTTLTATDKLYKIEVSNNHPHLEVKDIKLTCEYEKDDYNGKDKVDDTFITNNECKKYIEEVNNIIKYRNNILIEYK